MSMHPVNDAESADSETVDATDERRAMAALRASDPAEYDRRVAKIHQLILEGINSGPAIEMTPEAWNELWREADERFASLHKR